MNRLLMKCRTLGLSALILCSGAVTGNSQPNLTISIQADNPGAAISPAMWGIFFEDINFGADGGLYAELVKNRSFEFPDPLTGWKKLNENDAGDAVSVLTKEPFDQANPHYLRLQGKSGARQGVVNEGFRGIGMREGATYRFSAQVRGTKADRTVLRVAVLNSASTVIADVQLEGLGNEWAEKTIVLTASATEPKAALHVILDGEGTVDLDMVSLFPVDTWKGRPNGLRADLVQMLADLKPGFLRFPGGCIVEGRTLDVRYQWKQTIGKLAQRKLIINRWNDQFRHRPAPDYFQSFGLGFYEFFQLSEDIGAEPLPILNCGMACQFNTGELVPLDQLDPYIQDALDLIEFANGPTTSTWGSKRAELGHPAPFGMKLLGVGNEQWGPQYIERYARFAKVLKEKHPDIQLISSAGPQPADERFHYLWPKLRELNAEIIDEHCYAAPAWFFNNSTRYDTYDRAGPKVFMGEYAAQSVQVASPDNRNNWECALSEAAFMIGLERNADVVVMSSYAPLSGHVDGWQWTPNLFWFDNLRVFATPSYYVQQLFSRNRGDVLLPVMLRGTLPGEKAHPRFYASSSRENDGDMILKVVNASPHSVLARLEWLGAPPIKAGTVTVLTSSNLEAENSLDQPRRVAPRFQALERIGSDFEYTFSPTSFTVLRVRTQDEARTQPQ